MNRRGFLASLAAGAGTGLFAPFARQAMANQVNPRRYVFVVEGNGLEPVTLMSSATRTAIDAQASGSTAGRRWMPRQYGHATPLVLPNDLSTALALDPLANGGFDLTTKASVVLGLSSTITGGGHSTHFGALTSTRSTPARPAGPSIDALLAEVPDVRLNTPFDALRVGVDAGTNALSNSICAYDTDRPAPVVVDPHLAYNSVFGAVAGAAGQAAFARRGKLLEYARNEVNATLAQFTGNSRERAKLEAYLDSLLALRTRHDSLVTLGCGDLADFAPTDPATNPLYTSAAPLDHVRAQFELVTASLLGNLTNVAVIASGAGGKFDLAYPNLIEDIARHDLHHLSTNDPAMVDVIHAATREHVAMIATMARTLEAVPEGNGTMLDNTLIVYLSDNGESHHSDAEEWPVLMVGGGNMGFLNDGRTTVFPGINHSNNRQLSNLFNTIGHSAGLNLNEFGGEGPSRIAAGPLSELRS